MEFKYPYYLLFLLLLIPYIIWLIIKSKRSLPDIFMPTVSKYRFVSKTWRTRLVNLPSLLHIIFFISLVIIIARPQINNSSEDKDVESVDELYERARLWLEKITSLYNNQVVLAVSHGLFLRFIQAVCRNTSIKDIPRMDNTEIRRLLVHQPTSCDTSGEQVESVES